MAGDRLHCGRLAYDGIVGVLLLILVVMTLSTSVTATNRLRQATECQTRVNAAYREIMDQRNSATVRIREAQIREIETLIRPGASLAQPAVSDALRGYLDALHADQKARADNPIPRDVMCSS